MVTRLLKAPPKPADRILGCLLGGAVGDALGAGIEFLSLGDIRRKFGASGVTEFTWAYGRLGAITDDTQMTLFTAEGLIRALLRQESKGVCHPPSVVHHAYLRWLSTQGQKPRRDFEVERSGWLVKLDSLNERRAPGNTCLSALVDAEGLGTPARARNNSKGCGGVMRVAPVGLFAPMVGNDAAVFELGAALAALTHGHPSGFLAAGYFAVVIAALCRDCTLDEALVAADVQLAADNQSGEIAHALAAAKALAKVGRPSPEAVETLGRGWVAEEALAIAIYCSLVAVDFDAGVLLATDHSGDSDSTASITGNILGARDGVGAVRTAWLDRLELRPEIEQLAHDLGNSLQGMQLKSDLYPPF